MVRMSLLLRVSLLIVAGLGAVSAADLKVGVFHPLLVDLAKQVGGDRVEVVNLAQGTSDLHRFQPGPKELSKARGAQLYLAAGKGFEPYLGKIQSIVGKDRVLEVGRKIPSLSYGKGSSLHACCPDHSNHNHGGLDPHWWHSIDAWRRAASIVADEFSKRDPANKQLYAANAKRFRGEMDALNSWAKGQMKRVPKSRRTLATAHAAFGYLCKDFGWKMLPVQGVNREQSPSPQWLGEMAAVIKREQIVAIFPEESHNPKALQSLAKQTGVRVGKPLIADGGTSVSGMFRHNIGTIVGTLAQ
jgi:zinc/manganese transport system substrate-binding protein